MGTDLARYFTLKKKKKSFPGGQTVKNLPAMQETWVQPPSGKDPLEKGMTTNSSILAWRIPWTEEPGGLQSWGHKESDITEPLTLHIHTKRLNHKYKLKGAP